MYHNFSGVREPKRESMDQLENDAAQAPHIYAGDIGILFHVIQHVRIVFFFVFEKDIVEEFRTHIFRSG